MKLFVIGCGRWGTFIAWYLDHIGHEVTLYGREGSKNMETLMRERKNEYITLPDSLQLTNSLEGTKEADTIVYLFKMLMIQNYITPQTFESLAGDGVALSVILKDIVENGEEE